MFTASPKTELDRMVSKDEKILWRGRPNKKCFILECIFNPMLPVAFIWFLIDSFFIFGFSQAEVDPKTTIFTILFFCIHLMPVWIYLGGIIASFLRYKNTQYIVTEKGVYISGGVIAYSCQMKPFAELARVNIHRGIFDQLLGVGDVVLTSNNVADYVPRRMQQSNPFVVGLTIADIHDYRDVYELIKKLQEDIYSDTMYPNDLRPAENHGYKTEYKGLDDERGSLDI